MGPSLFKHEKKENQIIINNYNDLSKQASTQPSNKELLNKLAEAKKCIKKKDFKCAQLYLNEAEKQIKSQG